VVRLLVRIRNLSLYSDTDLRLAISTAFRSSYWVALYNLFLPGTRLSWELVSVVITVLSNCRHHAHLSLSGSKKAIWDSDHNRMTRPAFDLD
jgi:hypothetical protein